MPEILALMAGLAPFFAAEGRPGGDQARPAIIDVLADPIWRDTLPANPLPGLIETAVTIAPHPVAPLLLAAHPHLTWHSSGMADGRIRPDLSARMITAEILGPDGILFHPTARISLFAQSAGVDYVTREHTAEEAFVMLTGSGEWSADRGPLTPCYAGDMIHHSSMVPHVSVTHATPFVAAWRWSGEIGYGGHALTG